MPWSYSRIPCLLSVPVAPPLISFQASHFLIPLVNTSIPAAPQFHWGPQSIYPSFSMSLTLTCTQLKFHIESQSVSCLYAQQPCPSLASC